MSLIEVKYSGIVLDNSTCTTGHVILLMNIINDEHEPQILLEIVFQGRYIAPDKEV